VNLLIEWINNDRTQLPASLHRFVGHSTCDDTAALRTDLARFQRALSSWQGSAWCYVILASR
jgi:hypothetical protein